MGSPRRRSTRCPRALGHRMQRQFFTLFQFSYRHPRRSSHVVIPATLYAGVSVLQPGGSGDTSVDTVETEPHLEAPSQHVAGSLAVPGSSGADEDKVLMDSGSGITAVSAKLVEALQAQPGMTQTALTQAFVGHARVVMSLAQECDIETQSCPLHLTIETRWGPVRFTMPFIVLPGGGNVVIIGQKTLRGKVGIDAMAQLKSSVLKAGRQDGAGVELTARSVGEPNNGAVLRAAMAATASVLGADAPGDVDEEVALTLPSQRPMIFQDSEVEMRDRVGVFEAAVDNAADHSSPSEYAKMMRCIVFRTHLDVLSKVLSGNPHAHEKPRAVRCHSSTMVLRAKPSPERNRLRWSAAESCPDFSSVVTTSSSSRLPGRGRRRRIASRSRGRACLRERRRAAKKAQGAAAVNDTEARTRTAIWAAFSIISWFGGIPNFELLIFGLIGMLNLEFFANMEFLRRALMVPDAATAGGISPGLCVDKACSWLMLPF